MCTVIGIAIPDVTAQDIELIHRVVYEARIRGLHATGVSYVEDGVIQTIKEPVGAAEFLSKYSFADFVDSDGSLRLIAHTRYSTSDLEFNQPIANSQLALVHNGVISQELPENWERLYGLHCDTRNDTELLFKTVEATRNNPDIDPLGCWPDASIAAIELYANGTVIAYRNGRRPLHSTVLYPGKFLIASTADILTRAGVLGPIIPISPDHYYEFHPGFELPHIFKANIKSRELQP